jgi:hypothetical protein
MLLVTTAQRLLRPSMQRSPLPLQISIKPSWRDTVRKFQIFQSFWLLLALVVFEEIVRAINGYGEPFMKQEGDLATIIRDLETLRFTNQTSASHRLPIAYRLAGRADEAHAYLIQHWKDISDRNDLAAHEMKVFFNALLQHDV